MLPISLHLKLLAPFASPSCEYLTLFLDNFVRAQIHGDGIVGLDCLVEVGSHNISLDDLSIQDCTCWKRDHIYAGTIR